MVYFNLWIYLGIFLFAGSLVALWYLRGQRKLFHAPYHDELVREKEGYNGHEQIYFTSGETRKYIMRYLINSSRDQKYVICNLNKTYRDIKYFILCFNKKGRVIDRILVHETFTNASSSKFILLKKRTVTVNIVIGSVDGVLINHDVFKPVSKAYLLLYSAIRMLACFSALMALKNIILKIIYGNYIYGYVTNDVFYSFSIYYVLLISFVYAVISLLALNKRNNKILLGGVLEHEFY